MKINKEFIFKSVNVIKHNHPTKSYCYITNDNEMVLPETDNVPQRIVADKATMNTLDPSIIYIPYFTDMDLVKDFCTIANKKRIQYIPPQYVYPTIKFWQMKDKTEKLWHEERQNQDIEGFSKWDNEDFSNLLQAADMVKNVQGDIIEIGCYMGSSSRILARYIREVQKSDRPLFFYDTFEGFAYKEAQESVDANWANSHPASYTVVKQRLEKVGKNITVAKCNICTEELTSEKIAMASIDVDMYEAVAAGLKKVHKNLVQDGVIVCEDYGHLPLLYGGYFAVEEFYAKHKKEYHKIFMESGQCILIRK